MAKHVNISPQTWRKLETLIKDQSPDKTHLLGKLSQNHNTVLVRASEGWFPGDIPQFGIIDPGTSAMVTMDGGGMPVPSAGFAESVVLAAWRPGNWNGSNAPLGGFLIACEPIKVGTIGRAWYAGYCPVRIQVHRESHEFADADIANQEIEFLVSRTTGPCKIIWKEYGTGLKWAIVYHSGLVAAAAAPQLAWIKLTNVSLHPMQGLIQAFNPATGTFGNDWRFWNDPVDVYRYPTHTNNNLYETNNIIAAVRMSENKYISLHTLPIQLAVSTYSGL